MNDRLRVVVGWYWSSVLVFFTYMDLLARCCFDLAKSALSPRALFARKPLGIGPRDRLPGVKGRALRAHLYFCGLVGPTLFYRGKVYSSWRGAYVLKQADNRSVSLKNLKFLPVAEGDEVDVFVLSGEVTRIDPVSTKTPVEFETAFQGHYEVLNCNKVVRVATEAGCVVSMENSRLQYLRSDGVLKTITYDYADISRSEFGILKPAEITPNMQIQIIAEGESVRIRKMNGL